MCLAVATHDPRSCAGTVEAEQLTCEALASGDASRCAKGNSAHRSSCTRDLARLRTLLGERPAHDATAPRARIEIHGISGAKDPSPTSFDLSSSVAGGAVIAAEAMGGAGIELARDLDSTLRLPTRMERSRLSATVVFEAGGPKLTKLDVTAPGVPELTCPSPHCNLNVAMPKADPLRGAPLTATIAGTVETITGTYRLNVQIDTFVRDVVGRMAIYGGR
jgi:hypothetical protein